MTLLSGRALSASDLDADLVVGRQGHVERVAKALRLGFNVYVHGSPGSGRTTFLRQIQRVGVSCVSVDLNGLTDDSNLAEALTRISAALAAPAMNSPAAPRCATPGHPHAHRAGPPRAAAALTGPWDLPKVPAPQPSTADASRHTVVVVDNTSAQLRDILFGVWRDDMWELSLQWVVAGDVACGSQLLETFFATRLHLEPFDVGSVKEMLSRRLAASPDQAALPEGATRTIAEVLAPCTPRLAMHAAASIAADLDPAAAISRLRQSAETRRDLPAPTARALDALVAHGPAHAGDANLVAAMGVTRSRLVSLLAELETVGLATSQRAGRRKVYAALPALT